MHRMQLVVPLGVSPEAYVREKFHIAVQPPVCCPNCGSCRRLQALGYYERSVTATDSSNCLRFLVRRFRCVGCGRTTSLLPNFSQPYRLVGSEAIDRFFEGRQSEETSFPWRSLLKRYWHRFADWLPELRRKLGLDFRLEVPADSSTSAWRFIDEAFGGVAPATSSVAAKSKVTLFGIYRCHQPYCSLKKSPLLHTSVLFQSGKDPPN